MASVGRKFLLAGRGGLNLTHSEPLEDFLGRYRPPNQHLRAAIEAFPPLARCVPGARRWDKKTFVGTSGRVFPKAMKASPLLRAWLRRLQGEGVTFAMRHCFIGWQDLRARLRPARRHHRQATPPDATVLALGGASWPRLGSDGGWVACTGGRRGGRRSSCSPPIAASWCRGRSRSATAVPARRSSASP